MVWTWNWPRLTCPVGESTKAIVTPICRMIGKKISVSQVNVFLVRGHDQHPSKRVNTSQKQLQLEMSFTLVTTAFEESILWIPCGLPACYVGQEQRWLCFCHLNTWPYRVLTLYPVPYSTEEFRPVHVLARWESYFIIYIFGYECLLLFCIPSSIFSISFVSFSSYHP